MTNYLSVKQVAEKIDVKGSTLLKWIRTGRFPRPDYRLSRRVIYWKPETVETFIESHTGNE